MRCSGSGAAAKLAAKNASFKEVMILAVPMLFDLTATLLMSIGLLCAPFPVTMHEVLTAVLTHACPALPCTSPRSGAMCMQICRNRACSMQGARESSIRSMSWMRDHRARLCMHVKVCLAVVTGMVAKRQVCDGVGVPDAARRGDPLLRALRRHLPQAPAQPPALRRHLLLHGALEGRPTHIERLLAFSVFPSSMSSSCHLLLSPLGGGCLVRRTFCMHMARYSRMLVWMR